MNIKPSVVRIKSEDSSGPASPKSPRAHVFHAGADVSDIHICVLCLKALMNNAVSMPLLLHDALLLLLLTFY